MYDNTTITDAELVAGHLAGDRGAFAAIYDRYGDALYDVAAAMLRNRHDAADVTQDTFVVAAERMTQLRDPARLKPWLMAILRNEVYRRSGKRSRQVPTDFTMVGAEMALPPAAPDDASAAEFEELATLVRDAAAGLDDRDQLVLELAVRQGLEGDDLAAALGVTAQQSYSLVHRMRQRTERSLGAFCVARRGRRECPELDRILAGWDGQFSVLIRKRVARHIDDCSTCERSRKKFVPLMLFGSAPAFAAPPDLRARVLEAVDAGAYGLSSTAPATRAYQFTAPGGFPTALKYSRRVVLWWLMGAAALMLLLGAGVFVLGRDADDSFQLAINVPEVPTATTTAETAPTQTSPPNTSAPTTQPTTSGPATSPTTAPPTSVAPATVPSLNPFPPKTTAVVTTTTTTTTTTTEPEVAPPPTVTVTTTTAPATTTTAPTTTATTTTVPAPNGALFLSASSLDFGESTSVLTVQLTNEGAGEASWSASVVAGLSSGPFSVSPANGTLPPNGIQTITVTMNRAGLGPGSYSAAIRFTATGTSAQLTAQGSVPEPEPTDTTPPSVRIQSFEHYSCNNVVTVVVEATDPESAITGYAGSVSWGTSTANLTFDGNVGSAVIPPPPLGVTVAPLIASVEVTNSAGLTGSAVANRQPENCIN